MSHGFLEFARPTIGSVLDSLRVEGAHAIDAVPGMLFAAGHAKNDIPSVLNGFAAANPGVPVRYGRDLAVDPLLLRAAAERIEAAAAPGDAGPAESLLVVVGRGTSDPDANSNIAKVTRMLWEGLGFGWAETCYSGVTTPLVGPALARIAGFGFGASSSSPTSSSPACWCGASTTRWTRPPWPIPAWPSARPATSTTTRWWWTPSSRGSPRFPKATTA